MLYKVEIIEKENLNYQLEVSKSSIKDLFADLLNETKAFKYQITVKVLLKKYKHNEEIEFAPIYLNLTTITVIRHQFSLKNAFQKIFTPLMSGLIKDLAGLFNQSSLNTLTFRLKDHYQEVLT